jgi:hypothetical protein
MLAHKKKLFRCQKTLCAKESFHVYVMKKIRGDGTNSCFEFWIHGYNTH